MYLQTSRLGVLLGPEVLKKPPPGSNQRSLLAKLTLTVDLVLEPNFFLAITWTASGEGYVVEILIRLLLLADASLGTAS